MMKTLLIETLESLGYPVYLQGGMAADEPYPDHFFTIWTDNSESAAHYDNDSTATEWSFQVMFYSVSPAIVATEAERSRATLKAAGFIPQGKGHDLISDEPTHTGWANDYLFRE